MCANNDAFMAWEEHLVSQEKGNRVVHYYLKVSSGDFVLAVVGTERSIRHMLYVVSDEFLGSYGSHVSSTKWRTRREVVDWLTCLVSKYLQPSFVSNSHKSKTAETLGSQKSEMAGFANLRSQSPEQMIQVPRKLGLQDSDIVWSNNPFICCKQLKHYPAFSRNGTTIAVYSFAFIMAEEENQYLGYLEDLYEDKKRRKMVKVRWFHRSHEVSDVIPDAHPHEVIITPHVQVISAECIDGPATILTPKHYEECLAVVSQDSSSGIYTCSRQIENHKVKPFSLTKLRGYSSQAIFSVLDCSLSLNKLKQQISNEEEEEDVAWQDAKGTQSSRGVIKNLISDNHVAKAEPTPQKLIIKLSGNGPVSIKLVGSEPQSQVLSFSIDQEIELLSQDSGTRGCWFRCKILQVSQQRLKVLYKDVEDVECPGNLEEWVPAYKVAAPDKVGMRCSGRHTIRTSPPKNSSYTIFSIGSPVDAWWCDGWWEGVVVGVDIPGKNSFHVYFPGENRFQNVLKNKLRASKDWVNNMWIDITPKPDILSLIASNVNSKMKLGRCSPLGGASSLLDCKILRSSEKEAVEEERQEMPVSAATDVMGMVNDFKLKTA